MRYVAHFHILIYATFFSFSLRGQKLHICHIKGKTSKNSGLHSTEKLYKYISIKIVTTFPTKKVQKLIIRIILSI